MRSITVIVPAYNEEGNLAATVQEIAPLLEKEFADHEILIFNDCSRDRTGAVADDLARRHPKIKVVHNPENRGLGYNYKKGVEMARMDYIIMIPGDNEITLDSFAAMFRALGQKDMVIPYTVNTEIRPWARRVLSRLYTVINNLLFGTRLRYFNGTVIHKRAVIQSVAIETDSFAYQTELLVKLIKAGHTYVETGMYLKERTYGKSSALKLKNVARVFKSIWGLFWLIHFGKKTQGQ